MPRLSGIIVAAAAIFAVSPLCAQTYYKWVDAKGVTHYGAAPPSDGKSSKLELHSDSADSGPAAVITPNASASDADAANDQYKKQSCAAAKNDLKLLDSGAMIVNGGSTANPTGIEQASKLTQGQRDAARVQANHRVHEFCDNG